MRGSPAGREPAARTGARPRGGAAGAEDAVRRYSTKNARRAARGAPAALTFYLTPGWGPGPGAPGEEGSKAGGGSGSVGGGRVVGAGGQPDHMLRLRPAFALNEIELDLLTFAERLIAFLLDRGEVDKD